jgi:hypothetical protein
MKKNIVIIALFLCSQVNAQKTDIIYYNAEFHNKDNIDSVILDPYISKNKYDPALDPARCPVLEPALTTLAQLNFLRDQKAVSRKVININIYIGILYEALTRGESTFVITSAQDLRQATQDAQNWIKTLPQKIRKTIPAKPDISGQDTQDNWDVIHKLHAVDDVLPSVLPESSREVLRKRLVQACEMEKWGTVDKILNEIFFSLPADFSFAQFTLPPLFQVQIKRRFLEDIDPYDTTVDHKALSDLKIKADQILTKEDTKRAHKMSNRIQDFLVSRKRQ